MFDFIQCQLLEKMKFQQHIYKIKSMSIYLIESQKSAFYLLPLK